METTNIVYLSHKQHVYLETWVGAYTGASVEVCTLRGYCEEKGWNYEEERARSVKNNEDIAWTYHKSACLYGDREAGARAAERRRLNRESAMCVQPGQLVEIDGDIYKVSVSRLNIEKVYNSSPISFALQK